MSRPLIIATGSVAVVAAVLTLIWTMQRRLMYFPIDDVPTPGEIGLSGVEPVTFETTDALRLNGWFVAASGPSPLQHLVIAGARDRIVPIENSRRLYDAAGAPKTLLLLPNADHNDDELLTGEEMIHAIVHFLQPLA